MSLLRTNQAILVGMGRLLFGSWACQIEDHLSCTRVKKSEKFIENIVSPEMAILLWHFEPFFKGTIFSTIKTDPLHFQLQKILKYIMRTAYD